MDPEANFNVLLKFKGLDFRDKILWLLAIGMAAVIAVSIIYEISLQPAHSSVTGNTTSVRALTGSPRTFTMDPQGNMWVWTYGHKLLIYDGETWETLDEIYDLTSGELYVLDIAFDSHGQAWIGTSGQGLITYDGENLEQVDISLTGEYVETIAFDANDRAWIGTGSRLHVSNGESWQTYTSDSSVLSGRISDIAFDSLGQAWIGTSNGLVRFDGQNWEAFTPENSGLVNKFVTVVAVDAQDQIWVGTEGGLNQFDGQAWETYLVQSADFDMDYIQDIFFDSDAKMWVFSHEYRPNEAGTNSGTVSVLDGGSWFTFDRLNRHRMFWVEIDPEGRVRFLLDDRSILITSSDLSDPIFERGAQEYVEPDVRYPFLRTDSLIKPLLGLAFIWVMIYVSGLESNFSSASILIPVLSLPIFFVAGFNLEAEDFYIPFGNILLLFFGLYLAGKGNRAGESRGQTAMAIILNIVMLFLYAAQFLFMATFG